MRQLESLMDGRKTKSRETAMHSKAHAAIRTELVGRLRQLRGMASHTVSGMKNDRENPADIIDLASREESRHIELAIRGRERETIQDIENAIARIDSGEFGICEECSGAITIGRLLAKPTTTYCRTCQEKRERAFRGQGQPEMFRAA